MTKTLLLAQPLRLDDIKINLDIEEQPQVVTSTINIVDDAELLAILGLSSCITTAVTTITTPTTTITGTRSPVIELLDWQHDIPDLSECEEESCSSVTTSKRSREEDEDEEQDIFAQFDFEEVDLTSIPNNHKKFKYIQDEEQASDFVDLISASLF